MFHFQSLRSLAKVWVVLWAIQGRFVLRLSKKLPISMETRENSCAHCIFACWCENCISLVMSMAFHKIWQLYFSDWLDLSIRTILVLQTESLYFSGSVNSMVFHKICISMKICANYNWIECHKVKAMNMLTPLVMWCILTWHASWNTKGKASTPSTTHIVS